MREFPLSKVTEPNDTMNSQAKLTHRTPSSSPRIPVVRELPTIAGVAQTW
jgi:hypothetical protein